MVLLYGTIYALLSDLFEDGALNRDWDENLLRGALVGLIMAAVGVATRRPPVKFPSKTPPDGA